MLGLLLQNKMISLLNPWCPKLTFLCWIPEFVSVSPIFSFHHHSNIPFLLLPILISFQPSAHTRWKKNESKVKKWVMKYFERKTYQFISSYFFQGNKMWNLGSKFTFLFFNFAIHLILFLVSFCFWIIGTKEREGKNLSLPSWQVGKREREVEFLLLYLSIASHLKKYTHKEWNNSKRLEVVCIAWIGEWRKKSIISLKSERMERWKKVKCKFNKASSEGSKGKARTKESIVVLFFSFKQTTLSNYLKIKQTWSFTPSLSLSLLFFFFLSFSSSTTID